MAESITFKLQAFIKDHDWVSLKSKGDDVDYNDYGTQFNGNNRSWGSSDAATSNSKFWQRVIYYPAKQTFSYSEGIGETVKRTWNGKSYDYERDTAPKSDLNYELLAMDRTHMQIELDAATANPLQDYSPDIDCTVVVTIFSTGLVTVKGKHDGYPSFEMYKKEDNNAWVTVYQKEQDTLNALYDPVEVTVNVSKS